MGTPGFTYFLRQLSTRRLFSAEYTYIDHEKCYLAVWTQYSYLFMVVLYDGFESGIF
jgi:hypothetical protein